MANSIQAIEILGTREQEQDYLGHDTRSRSFRVHGTEDPDLARQESIIPKINDDFPGNPGLFCVSIDATQYKNCVNIEASYSNPEYVNSQPLFANPRFSTTVWNPKETITYEGYLIGSCQNIGVEIARGYTTAELDALVVDLNMATLYEIIGLINAQPFMGASAKTVIFTGISASPVYGNVYRCTFQFMRQIIHVYDNGNVVQHGPEFTYWFPGVEQKIVASLCETRRRPLLSACRPIHINEISGSNNKPCSNRVYEVGDFEQITQGVIRWL